MNTKCDRLFSLLKTGHFGTNLNDLPQEFKDHLNECKKCQAYLEELTTTELKVKNNLRDCNSSDKDFSHLKREIMNQIQRSQDKRFEFNFRPRYAAGLAGIIIVIVISMTYYSRTIPSQSIAVTIQPEIIEEYYYATSPLKNLDNELISSALMNQLDPNIVDATLTQLQNDDNWLYEEDTIKQLETLNEQDWQALRRFLS